MEKVIKESTETPVYPATTPEAQENKLIALAINEAERRLSDGTASNQIIVHYLKLATMRENKEREILDRQSELLKAKTDALKANQQRNDLYADAIRAMKEYSNEIVD